MRRFGKASIVAGAAVVLSGAAAVFALNAAYAAPTRYEAETSPATCSGTIDSNHAGFSGTGFCNGTNTIGAAAQFTVNAGSAGTATLNIRYANGTTTNRPADILVNGGVARAGFGFEGTGAWTGWATKTTTVQVNAGSNTIRLSPTTANGLANIDYLDFEVGVTSPPPSGSTLYVATNGNDSNPGTLAQPLRTVQRAVDLAQPGYTIFIRRSEEHTSELQSPA